MGMEERESERGRERGGRAAVILAAKNVLFSRVPPLNSILN